MNKIKFFHPITGKMLTINCAQGIMGSRKAKTQSVVSVSKVCIRMWAQGYVRAGKNVVLTDFEKAAIALAPKVIVEMKTQIKKQEADAGLPDVDSIRAPILLPSIPPMQVGIPHTPTPIPAPVIQVETVKRDLSAAEKLAALRASRV